VLLPRVISERVTIGGKRARVWRGIKFETNVQAFISYYWCRRKGEWIIYNNKIKENCLDICPFAPQCNIKKVKDETFLCRFITDVPYEIVGVDGKTYGPFKLDDVVKLPRENAELMVKQGLAKAVEVVKDE
jgi:hypothetical protein